MDLQQAKIVLEKINALYKSMSMDGANVAAIERDLMLSYLRQMYAIVQDNATSVTTPKVAESKAATTSNRPELEIVEPKSTAPEPKKTAYKPPRIIEIPDSLKELEKEVTSPIPTTVPTPPVQKATPPPPPPPQVVAKPSIAAVPEGYEVLFEHHIAKELSEKLSERPIHDLSKALAINDRLLYMNELFGKNMDALNSALSQFNQFHDIDEAKGFIISLAQKHNWTQEDRLDTAKEFVKTVRRRYVS